MKKKIILTIITIIVIILVSVIVFSPLIARLYINKNGKELTGRTINLKKVRVNFFTFTIRAIGFKMFEKNDTSVFTGFDTLLVDLQPLKLIRSELSVKRLWLINPESGITKSDTVFNFTDIVDFFSSPDTAAMEDTSSAKSDFKFELSDIRLRNGNISYTDEEINHTTILDNLNFTIPYLSWNQKESSKAGLRFNFRNGGYFMADGTFDPGSGNFRSGIEINNLDLNEFSSYIRPYLLINNIEGLAGCNLEIGGSSNEIDSLSVNGRFYVNSLSVTDSTERRILGVDGLDLTLNPSFPMAGKFEIDTLTLTKPYLLFEMHDSSNNFIELLPPEKSDTLAHSPDDDSASVSLTYSLNSFIMNEGIVDFTDITLKEPFTYHLSQIKLDVDSVSSSSTWLTAYSGMKLNERGDLKAEIGFNPRDPYELKVDYVITNFQLPDISPYSKFYLGSAIVYGNMFYTGNTSITSRKITSDNKLIIRNAEIGKKSGGIFNVPLRLALYLIKDLNGDIKIDLPVSGDLNDPKIKLGPLIWATFKNFILKVAATPFIALANIFGVDQKDLQQIDFNYADTTLSETNIRKLDQLLLIKDRKPEMNIELAYLNDRAKEKEQIGYEIAGSIFKEQGGGDYISQSDEFKAFLMSSLAKDTTDLYNDCIKLAGIEKVALISNDRDKLRLNLVEDHLKSKDSLFRIKIFVPDIEAIKNVGSQPVFEVKFSMEE